MTSSAPGRITSPRTAPPVPLAERSAPTTMRAITHAEYGSPDVLRLCDVPTPAPGDNDVLVRVYAAALHAGDVFTVRGAPLPVRMETGWLRPRVGIPGYDVAGTVVAVGSKVTRFRPGDQVFGVGRGTCAELTLASQDTLARKPDGLTFEEAAAIPTSGLAALHGLRDCAGVREGQSVLVNGASGGVGSFAVQIAKALGAEVTGVCSTRNVELVRSLGADHVIDYTRDDFTASGRTYDVIFDNVENRSLADCRRALSPSGTLVLNSGTGAEGLAFAVRLIRPLLISPFVSQNLRRYLSMPNHADLVQSAELADTGAARAVIDSVHPLEETPEALQHVATGHARGKVVIRVA